MAVGAYVEGAWSLFIFRLDGQGAGGGGGGPLRIESRMLLNGKPVSVCLSHAKDGPWGDGDGVRACMCVCVCVCVCLSVCV